MTILAHRIINTGPDKEWLLLLHGLFESSATWDAVLDDLIDLYNVVTVDLPGHGDSRDLCLHSGIEDIAVHIRELLDSLGISTSYICGFSMGGRIAFIFASKYPEYVNGLVVEDIGPDAVLSIDNYRHERERLKCGDKKRDNKGRRFWLFNMTYVEGLLKEIGHRDFWCYWDNLNMPTLIIRAGESQNLTVQEAARMHHRCSNCHLVEIGGVRHNVHMKKPKEYMDSLTKFTSKIKQKVA